MSRTLIRGLLTAMTTAKIIRPVIDNVRRPYRRVCW